MRDQRHAKPLAERFWPKVLKGPACWEWTGSRSKNYGRLLVGSRSDGSRAAAHAHRVAWELANGPIPGGLHVLHRCDNPGCVRPDHLFLGTQRDNNRDRDAKGRCARKLADADVMAIRALYAAGAHSQSSIAAKFNVTQTLVSRIVRGRCWAKTGERS